MDKFNVNIIQPDCSELENLFRQRGTIREFKKKEYFARQNERTNHIGFVDLGIFRLTRIDDKANERIIGYSFKNDFVSDYPALANKTSSRINIQAVTDSKAYLLTFAELNDFWETNMDTQRLGRLIAESMFATISQRLFGFYCETPEQRYIALMERCPDLKEKIPLKEIASFLGVTPETISHIRKRMWKK